MDFVVVKVEWQGARLRSQQIDTGGAMTKCYQCSHPGVREEDKVTKERLLLSTITFVKRARDLWYPQPNQEEPPASSPEMRNEG